MPRVSVVIPAFNPGEHLKRSIASVQDQTFDDWEMLVVDDGGAEDLSWVDRLGDARIRRIRQANRGVSTARNVGVATASADLVAFLDQDDEWLPSKLDAQVAAMSAQPQAVLCYTGFEWVHPCDVVVHPDDLVTYRGLLVDQHICLSSTLARRDAYLAVGGHDPLLALMQDYDWFLRMTMHDDPVGVPEVLCRYHVHGGNASASSKTDYGRGHAERSASLRAHQRAAIRRGDQAAGEAAQRGLAWTDHIYGPMAYDHFRVSVRAKRPDLHHLAAAARMAPRFTGGALARSLLRGRQLSD